MVGKMKIHQVKKFPIYDIFTGNGWLNWTRILIDKSKKITTIAGEPWAPLPDSYKDNITNIQQLAKQSRDSNQQVYHANKSN